MQCNATVLTTEAYTAMTNGTCTPSCPPSLPCSQVCPGSIADLWMSAVGGPEWSHMRFQCCEERQLKMYTPLLSLIGAALMDVCLFWGQSLLQHQGDLKLQDAMDTPFLLCGICIAAAHHYRPCLPLQAPAPAPVPALAPAFAPAPGPAQIPWCPGGFIPVAWNCTHLEQPFLFDAASYLQAAPLAAREKQAHFPAMPEISICRHACRLQQPEGLFTEERIYHSSMALPMPETLEGVTGLCADALRESRHAVSADAAWWESRMCCAEEL